MIKLQDTNLIIEEKPAFTLVGIVKDFAYERCFQDIPLYWREFLSNPEKPVRGEYGVCINKDNCMRYMIADVYNPHQTLFAFHEVVSFEAGLWAMFSATGPLPEALQEVTDFVWKKWVPGNREYEVADNRSIEFYPHTVRDSEYTHSEIWLPISKKRT